MSDPRAFISFDFDHNESEKMLFVGQAKNSRTPFKIEDWSAKISMPEDEWKKIVEEKIKQTNMLIVLVGRFMASAKGVDKEIKMAKDNDVPVFGVYVGGANNSSNLPYGLQRNRTIEWCWEDISKVVDQVMREGKNRY